MKNFILVLTLLFAGFLPFAAHGNDCDATWNEARTLEKRGSYLKAAEVLEEFSNSFPQHPCAPSMLIHALHNLDISKKKERLWALAVRLLREYGDVAEAKEYALWQLATLRLPKKDPDFSRIYAKKYLHNFPDGRYTKDVQIIIRELEAIEMEERGREQFFEVVRHSVPQLIGVIAVILAMHAYLVWHLFFRQERISGK